MKNVFLIGFMGVGKSTVAKALEEKLKAQVREMDQLIAEGRGMSIPEIFEKYGEFYFRNLESNCLIELSKKTSLIVSCGGGIVKRPENVDIMRDKGHLVLLTADPKTIYERVKDSNDRPLLNNNMNVDHITKLMKEREKAYLDAADITISTDGKTVDEICDELISRIS